MMGAGGKQRVQPAGLLLRLLPRKGVLRKLCCFPSMLLFPHQPGTSLDPRADGTTSELFFRHSEETHGLQNEGEGTIASPPGLCTGG